MSVMKYKQVMVVDTQSTLPTVAEAGDIAYCMDVKLIFNFDGTTWVPSNRTVVKKSGVTVNGKVTGATLIYTLESSNLKFYPIMVVARVVNISGVIIRPTISIGTNSSSYDNIVTASLLATLLSTLGAESGAPQDASTSPQLAGGTAIYANVSLGATATTYQVKFDVIGYYDS